jgi:hypothetical protein
MSDVLYYATNTKCPRINYKGTLPATRQRDDKLKFSEP